MIEGTVNRLKNYIGGKWIEATANKTEKVYNPATGEIIAHVPMSTREDLNLAIKVAKEAFQSWREVPVPRRARIMFKYQQLLVENWDDLAKVITIENGKNSTEAHGEVLRGIENV